MRRVLCGIFLALLIASPMSVGAVDLNGRWRFELSNAPPAIVQVTQTGTALTIEWAYTLTGTVGATDSSGFTSFEVSWTDGTYQAQLAAGVSPSGNLLYGRTIVVAQQISAAVVAGTRCTCFDGNSTNGDGCDDACQVEPCWTCTGDPSVCSPISDSGACDDSNPCTTGETCTAGACGDGVPVAPPCFDISGPWTVHRTIPAIPDFTESMIVYSQHGTDLRLDFAIGSIDPMTGAFETRRGNLELMCAPSDAFDSTTGQVAADGFTFNASGYFRTRNLPYACIKMDFTTIGDHCGDGMLQGAEQCDDGNLSVGDGCTNFCAVEQCWTCTGTPSTCVPVGGGTCDDDNICTVNDTCAADGHCGGAPRDCGQCSYCDYFFGCIGPVVGLDCDDGNACTGGDICAGDGSCNGTSLCEPCFTCDTSLGCVARPQPVCKPSTVPESSVIYLKNDSDDQMDRLTWRWGRGADTMMSELGDPSNDNDVSLCVYDESSATPTLLFRAAIPAGPPWTANATGFRYRDTSGSADGVSQTLLKSSSSGHASARLKAKGIHLSDRANGLPTLPLPLPLRAQLQGENGLCLETRHDSSSMTKNDPARGLFKARGTP